MCTLKDRLRGAFYGTAIGDALGGPRQFCERDELPLLTDMKPIANFRMPSGCWSDDTSMMLCLAESLTKSGYGFPEQNAQGNTFFPYLYGKNGPQILSDQLNYYLKWFKEGYNTPTGKAFDIGGTTKRAMMAYAATGQVIANTTDEMFQGNGSIMRLAPIGMMFWDDEERAANEAMLSSQTTHANIVCLQACCLLAKAIVRGLQGRSKEDILAAVLQHSFCSELDSITSGDYQKKTRDQIESHGWVVATLEAALWCFYKTSSFEDGLILAVNLCHDADTVGAVFGALAGAYYGFGGVPDRWIVDLKAKEILESIYLNFESVITV